MWAQYKRTLVVTQILILLVTLGTYFGLGRQWTIAAMTFAMMQAGGVMGAAWAVRLKRNLLPLNK
jgi:hypothetical protein